MKAIIDTSVLKDFIDKNYIQNLVYNGNNIERFVLDGSVIWVAHKESSGNVVLEVEKITSNTYAGETLYKNEEFILLDIYPKPNGTVRVTYGGLTKTITDTSGAEEPNAQQVYFGTFNGITDSVVTPTSGTLTIEGDCVTFGVGSYMPSNKAIMPLYCGCITSLIDWGNTSKLVDGMFRGCTNLTSIKIPDSVTSIGASAFYDCTSLERVIFAKGSKLTSIGASAFEHCENLELLVIPEGVISIGNRAFYMDTETVSGYPTMYYPITKMLNGEVILPTTIQNIGDEVWGCFGREIDDSVDGDVISYLDGITLLSTTPPNITEKSFGVPAKNYITVPKGCGEIYKNAPIWSNYANRIVEAS